MGLIDVTASDSIGAVEDVSGGLDKTLVAGNDSIAISDSTDIYKNNIHYDITAGNDSISVTDIKFLEFYGNRVLSDAVAIVDQVTIDRVFLSDTLSVTDSVTITTFRDSADSVTVVDALSPATDYVRSSTDTLNTTDAATLDNQFGRILSDTAVLTDSTLVDPTKDRAPFDAVSVSDSIAIVTNSTRLPQDTFSLTDSVSAGAIRERVPATDSIVTTDSGFGDLTKSRESADSILSTDSTTVGRDIYRALSDSPSISDQAIASKSLSITINDSSFLTDTVTVEALHVDVFLSDQIFDISDSVVRETTLVRQFNDTLSVTDSAQAARGGLVDRSLSDTIALSDSIKQILWPGFIDNLSLFDIVQVEQLGAFSAIPSADGMSLTVNFSALLSYDHFFDLRNYHFEPLPGSKGVLFQVESCTPITTPIVSGTLGYLPDLTASDFLSNTFQIDSSLYTFTSSDIGRYVTVSNGRTPGTFRITGIVSSTKVTLDRPLYVSDPQNGSFHWNLTGAIQGAVFGLTNKATNQAGYSFSAQNLIQQNGAPYAVSFNFITTGILGPKLAGVDLTDEGVLVIDYDQPMRNDQDLVSPFEYSITGPSAVKITKVWCAGPTEVALELFGLGVGSYTLAVNISGTPKDLAGNPLEPAFNQAIFTGSIPLTNRSVFTDKGPISKPPLTLQTGTNAVLNSFTEISLPSASLTSALVNQYITLTGSAANSGTYRITGVLSPTKLRVQASLTLPDPSTISWEIFNPRNGEIADDPADVEVLINGSPITPVTVVGLMGQVVLPTMPLPDDDVKVNYSWVLNPTVDFRRLNSKEFRLNSWNSDPLYGISPSQHRYRYNNTLVRPSEFEPDELLATLDQPKLRDAYYRAYERAYTASLNDPNTLLLNSPIHKIAFPAPQRTVSESFTIYEASAIPSSSTPAWVKHGTGLESVAADLLTATDNTVGPFPVGQPQFWTQEIDLTFPHSFALSWRFYGSSVTTYNGVFSGLSVGYTDETLAYVIGFIRESGVKKIGLLKRGFADDASTVDSWVGGVDSLGVATGLPVPFDWGVLHSYRLFRDRSGVVSVYVDGNLSPTLRILPEEAPFLEEVNAPFSELQGVFFGSISREAANVSVWDFVRYLIIPTNPLQVSPSSFVSYEGSVKPEISTRPWTPIGYHGTETILANDHLLIDSTSATDLSTASAVGALGGDYRGFLRLEPLLSSASQIVVDVAPQLRTYTYGIDPYGMMTAVDDGNRLMQLAFFPSRSTPKFSYGGRSLPGDFSPDVWDTMGSGNAHMLGRELRISDTTVGDGKIFFIQDLSSFGSDNRVVASNTDYIFEFRNLVVSYTVDGAGFAGVFGQVDDGARAVGLMFEELSGVRYVSLNSDGTPLGSLYRFAFDWGDGTPHTYRFVKNTTGNLVSLFIDSIFVGSAAYSLFGATGGTPIISFGSATPSSAGALSEVDWSYCNVWRTRTDLKHYVGLWKGYDKDSLTGYHLPLKASGTGAQLAGNALGDSNADFLSASVTAGDSLVIDEGMNKGVYEVAAVVDANTLTISGIWPSSPTLTNYRIISEVDWTSQHKYRLIKDSVGLVSVFYDNVPDPLIQVGYNSIDLPPSQVSFIQGIANGLPSVAFGSFNSENLSQSSWDYVRYGIVANTSINLAAPHHQFLNQRNVMESPERLTSPVPHTLTDFSSSSTGIVPKQSPEFLTRSNLLAYTRLNEGTPLVPSTQNYQVRSPQPVQEYVSAINVPADVLNSNSFVLNDASVRYRLLVPDDVLYSALDVIEETSGDDAPITPFDDECADTFSGFQYTKEVCLTYTADTLPEDDIASPTPWVRQSDNPGQVTATVAGGVLTYHTSGSATVYKNNTALPDAPGLQTEAKFRLRLKDDATLGTGDTQVRFGLSAPGLTVALAFVTTPLAERYVLVTDLNNGNNLGSVNFDFLDGNYHTYRIVRDPGAGLVRVFIDS